MPSTSSAPVESTIRGSSGRNGSDAASEPAATMQCSKPTTVSPTAIVFGPVNAPLPRTTCTLRCFASDSRPPVSFPTTPFFHSRTLSMSTCGSPNEIPASPSSCASVSTFATCSSALDGMQPTFRQTPPSVSPRSISATDSPRSAARNAAVYPPGPPPSTATWTCTSTSDGRRRGRRRLLRLGPVGRGGLERHQHRALGHLVADLDLDRRDLAGRRRRDLHRRLVGLEHDQRRLVRDLVAGADQHLDDGDVGEVADVGDRDLHQSTTLRRSESTPTRCATKRAASAPSITRWS